jgi:hypothetical protein
MTPGGAIAAAASMCAHGYCRWELEVDGIIYWRCCQCGTVAPWFVLPPPAHEEIRDAWHAGAMTDPPRWLSLLALLSAACAVVALFGLWPVYGFDLFMHLTVGRWIWHRGIPYTDVFCYMSPGEPFLAHSWLAEVIFYGVEQATPVLQRSEPVHAHFGFRLLRLALISASLTAAVQTAQLLKAPWPALMLLAPWVLAILWARVETRPYLFSTMFLALELLVLMSVHTGHRSPRWLWVLPPLFAVWANSHGGWINGLAMLVAVTAAVAVMALRQCRPGHDALISDLPLGSLALVLCACVLALLVNPYGLALLRHPFDMQAGWIRARGVEWQAPWLEAGWSILIPGRIISLRLPFLMYVALLTGLVLLALRRWRTADLVPPAIVVLWLALSLRHVRAVGDAVLLTAPFVAAFLGSAWWNRPWPACVGMGLGLALLLSGAAVTAWMPTRFRGMDAYQPPSVAAAFERLALSGRVFAPDLNHWLLWKFHPRLTVDELWEYVHGSQRTAERDAAMADGLPSLLNHLARYQVDVIVLDYRRDPRGGALAARGWIVAHRDPRWVILVRHPSRKE